MKFLKFFQSPKEDLREHDYDAKEYPSSTTVLSALSTGFNLHSLPEDHLKMLSQRGTYIHALLESLFRKEIPNTWNRLGLDDKYKPDNLKSYALGAYKTYSKYENIFEVFAMEERILVNYNNFKYAIKPDGIFFDKKLNEYVLVDFKTFSSPLTNDSLEDFKINLFTKYKAQLISYIVGASNYYSIKISKGIILGMDKNGSIYEYVFDVNDLKLHYRLFLELLKFYNQYYEYKGNTERN